MVNDNRTLLSNVSKAIQLLLPLVNNPEMANYTACLLEFSEFRAGLLAMLKFAESVIHFDQG
jgi:hypothetical protein